MTPAIYKQRPEITKLRFRCMNNHAVFFPFDAPRALQKGWFTPSQFTQLSDYQRHKNACKVAYAATLAATPFFVVPQGIRERCLYAFAPTARCLPSKGVALGYGLI